MTNLAPNLYACWGPNDQPSGKFACPQGLAMIWRAPCLQIAQRSSQELEERPCSTPPKMSHCYVIYYYVISFLPIYLSEIRHLDWGESETERSRVDTVSEGKNDPRCSLHFVMQAAFVGKFNSMAYKSVSWILPKEFIVAIWGKYILSVFHAMSLRDIWSN